MESILKTLTEILRGELPKDAADQPCVLDEPIYGWFHGDRQIIADNELPAIVVDGSGFDMNWAAFHAYERKWNFRVMCYTRADDGDKGTSLLNEMTRLVVQTIRRHSRMWVFEPCLFDLKRFHSPTHLYSHATILGPVASDVKLEWQTRWNLTHRPQGSDPIPSAPLLGDEQAYVTAYLRYYNGTGALSLNSTLTYYDADGKAYYTNPAQNYVAYQRDSVNPVRLLSFVKVEDVQYSLVTTRNNQFLRASEIKVSAREIDPMHEFGPNNVSDPINW